MQQVLAEEETLRYDSPAWDLVEHFIDGIFTEFSSLIPSLPPWPCGAPPAAHTSHYNLVKNQSASLHWSALDGKAPPLNSFPPGVWFPGLVSRSGFQVWFPGSGSVAPPAGSSGWIKRPLPLIWAGRWRPRRLRLRVFNWLAPDGRRAPRAALLPSTTDLMRD